MDSISLSDMLPTILNWEFMLFIISRHLSIRISISNEIEMLSRKLDWKKWLCCSFFYKIGLLDSKVELLLY